MVSLGLERIKYIDHAPKVSAAVGAGDLDPGHEHRSILLTVDRSRDGVVECWPAASRFAASSALAISINAREDLSNTAIHRKVEKKQ
jgi:hypothetical protein